MPTQHTNSQHQQSTTTNRNTKYGQMDQNQKLEQDMVLPSNQKWQQLDTNLNWTNSNSHQPNIPKTIPTI